jgi:hypothetical protein
LAPRTRTKEQEPKNKNQRTIPKNNTQRGKATAAVEIPAELNTPEFRVAWADWLQHRREIRKPATATAQQKQLAALAKMGPARAVAAINHSIGNGWTGIFEASTESSRQTKGTNRATNGAYDDRQPTQPGYATF